MKYKYKFTVGIMGRIGSYHSTIEEFDHKPSEKELEEALEEASKDCFEIDGGWEEVE